jgi:hypothetical protein
LAGSVVALGLFAGTLRAEDVDPVALCDSAKAAFQAKKYGKAVSDLQLALTEVARLRMEALKTKLPGAPAGWTAQDAEGEMAAGWAWLGAGTSVKRRYEKGEANMSLEVWADAGMITSSFQMMLSNPMFVQPPSKIVTVKGRRAILEFRKDGNNGSLTIVLATPGAMVKLEGHGIAAADLTDVFGAHVDLDALEKAIQE